MHHPPQNGLQSKSSSNCTFAALAIAPSISVVEIRIDIASRPTIPLRVKRPQSRIIVRRTASEQRGKRFSADEVERVRHLEGAAAVPAIDVAHLIADAGNDRVALG